MIGGATVEEEGLPLGVKFDNLAYVELLSSVALYPHAMSTFVHVVSNLLSFSIIVSPV